jgi:hypothetical protein
MIIKRCNAHQTGVKILNRFMLPSQDMAHRVNNGYSEQMNDPPSQIGVAIGLSPFFSVERGAVEFHVK